MRSKRTPKPAYTAQNGFKGFLNIQLSDEDKSIIKSAAYDEATYASDLEKWIDNGFKFTFSSDDFNHCFQVIGTRQDKEHVDYGILLTGRGSTPVKALKQWVYVQTRLIAESDWASLLEEPIKREIDD